MLGLKGSEPWFVTEEYLVPVLENDPLLREPTTTHVFIIQPDIHLESTSDDWSDEDDEEEPTDPDRKIKALEKRLATARQSLEDYRSMVADKLNVKNDLDDVSAPAGAPPQRDDDSHYFESYGANGVCSTYS